MSVTESSRTQYINLCLEVQSACQDPDNPYPGDALVIRQSLAQSSPSECLYCNPSAQPSHHPSVCDPRIWQYAHSTIKPGNYFIRNRETNGQLTVWDWVDVPRAVCQVWPFDSGKRPERTWEIRVDYSIQGGLAIISHWRPGHARYLQEGPHIAEEKNLVRMFPVPNESGWFYICPTMAYPPSVILDPNMKGVGSRPLTMVTLRRLDDDRRAAQWQLVPTSL